MKAPAFQDGHAGYSNPIDEGNFITSVVRALQATQEWTSTALVIAYDDSDGWYDHQSPPIVNPSNRVPTRSTAQVSATAAPSRPVRLRPPLLLGDDGDLVLGRCGYGARMPLLLVSPYAKKNYIDHTLTDQLRPHASSKTTGSSGGASNSAARLHVASSINGIFTF